MGHPTQRRSRRRTRSEPVTPEQESPADRGNVVALALHAPSLLLFVVSAMLAAALTVVLPTSASATLAGRNGTIVATRAPARSAHPV